MMWTLLQANASCLTDSGDGASCMFGAFASATNGAGVFTLMVGGGLLLAFYLASDYSPAPVAVGTMLLGGILIPNLPAQYASIGSNIILLGFILGAWAIIRSYFLQVGRA